MIALALVALTLSGCHGVPGTSARLCATKSAGTSAPPGVTTAPARATQQWIKVDGRVAFRHRENGPVVVLSLSPDRKWLVFAIDPFSSGSIMADGLQLQIVSTHGGAPHPLGLSLAYRDYITWCGAGVVYVRGGDRIATDVKQLVYAAPPLWHGRQLWRDAQRTFASPTCAPTNDMVAVLTQGSSTNARFFSTRWQLWSVTLDGARRPLDIPPAGYADESPAWSPSGDMLGFVRERRGNGVLVVLSRGVKRIAALGYSLGFYGHHDWGLKWEQ